MRLATLWAENLGTVTSKD